jgi:antitoxin (DNA-binding transcriptional repressor) of toxin-antitoxin stability system
MKQVSKSQLKAKMLEYFREIEQTHETLVVTDHGKPTLKITPILQKKSTKEVFAQYQGKVIYHEPITTPTSEEWTEK